MKARMEDQQVLFDSYQDIITNYIASFEKANTPFSMVSAGKINVNFRYLEKFLKIIGIQLEGDKFYSVTKIMLSAKEGKVMYYDYSSFKNVAHLVLDQMPEFWTHFRLVLKTYQQHHLVRDMLDDAKIKLKIQDKKSQIDTPNHQYNAYIEFLCPNLDGKLIAWGLGEHLHSEQSNVQRQRYSINILKNFLKEKPEIISKDVDETLTVLKQYFLFKFDIVESVKACYLNAFFSFVVENFKVEQGYLNQFHGEHETDLLFKAYLNPIVDVLDLSYLIENVGFCDNCCTFFMKDATAIDYDLDSEIGWENQNNKDILRGAIEYCEQLVSEQDAYFYIEKVNFY